MLLCMSCCLSCCTIQVAWAPVLLEVLISEIHFRSEPVQIKLLVTCFECTGLRNKQPAAKLKAKQARQQPGTKLKAKQASKLENNLPPS